VNEGDLSGFVSGDRRPTAHFPDETLEEPVTKMAHREWLWPPGKLRLFTRLRSCLEDASRRRPLLAVIEDLQWADAGTVDFLVYLLERARHIPLALMLTSRPSGTNTNRRAYLERLSRHCRVTLRFGSIVSARDY